MKIIFIKDLKKQGHVNEVKEVSDGYAINFLIKNGYAVKYTKASSDILKRDITNKKNEDEKQEQEALKLKKKIEDLIIEIKVTSNKGKMFGSISTKQISEELKKKGITIDKKNILSSDSLSTLGVHEIDIKLYKKVIAKLKVNLLEK